MKQIFEGNLEAGTTSSFELSSEELSNGMYLLEMVNSLGQRYVKELLVIK